MHTPKNTILPGPASKAGSCRSLLWAILLVAGLMGVGAPQALGETAEGKEQLPDQAREYSGFQGDMETSEEEMSLSEPEQTISMEIRELAKLGAWKSALPQAMEGEGVTYDFPVTMNSQVEFYLSFFQNELRSTFSRWLSRSGRYLPLIQKQLAEAGLPLDLAYLPMIESGYNLTAYSSAQAVGPWQFMQATGRSYGLTVNEYIDERRDPIKSTEAAVAYLSDLYARFDSWHLAVAAYNAGEGRVQRALRERDSNDFWEIANGYYLPTETKLYVPKLIAAIMIARDPERYGFATIAYQEPLEYEIALVPRWTSLQAISLACGVELEKILDLNRMLRQAITPPTVAEYPVRVPPGTKELVAANLPRVQKIVTTEYREHRVAKKETLKAISRKYGLKKQALVKANKLRSEKVAKGQRLRIPHEVITYRLLPEQSQLAARQSAPAMAATDNRILHRVKKGETAGTIAQRYNVSESQLAAWNDLQNPGQITAGQQLALFPDSPLPDAPALAGMQIATIQPEQVKKAITGSQTRNTKKTAAHAYHMVKAGDTLWSIARKYQLSTRNIRRWNQMDNDTIQPGRRLVIKSAEDLDA